MPLDYTLFILPWHLSSPIDNNVEKMDGYVLDMDISISYFKWKHFDNKLLTQLVYIICFMQN